MDLLAQMATFVRVVETGSLSAAARAQKLSLPAVSRQLRALEEDLGVSLVARTTRRLGVTDAGRRWYERCLRVLREVDDARGAVGGGAVRGTLVVSASVTLGMRFVVPHVAPLLARHPQLSVELRLEDRVVDLAGDAVDVAIRAGVAPPDTASLVAQPILRFRRVVVASPAYLKKRGALKEPEQLTSHCCLVQLGGVAPLETWTLVREHDGDERRVAVRGALRTSAPAAIRELVRSGVGVALLADWLVEDDLAAGRLRRVLPAWASRPISAWAIYRAELRGSPRVRAFVDAIASGGAASTRAARLLDVGKHDPGGRRRTTRDRGARRTPPAPPSARRTSAR